MTTEGPSLVTVDVEDWHRSLNVDAPDVSSALESALHLFLDVLSECGAKATFFTLGDDVQLITGALQRCVRDGHEVASHGMQHSRLNLLSREQFRADLEASIRTIEEAAQVPCVGYRAPWFSMPEDSSWFYEELQSAGIHYHAAGAVLDSVPVPRCEVSVIPVPQRRLGPLRIGLLGGLWLRLLPLSLIRRMFAASLAEGEMPCLYLHPYEWERMPCDGSVGIRYLRRRYRISSTLPRLRALLSNGRWTSIEQMLTMEEG